MERRLAEELYILHNILEYNPAQLMMNVHNYDYTMRENIEKTKIKKLKTLIELRFKQEEIYNKSYNKVGASSYVELDKTGFIYEYNIVSKEFKKVLKQAVDSLLDLAIKEHDICYTDVYERLLIKYDNIKKKVASGKFTIADEMRLHNYQCMIEDYSRAKYTKHKLIDLEGYIF